MTTPPTDLLQAWLDGELSPAEAARVEAVVASDPAAAAFVGAMRDQGERLRAAPLPSPAADAHGRWLADWQTGRDRAVRRLAGWMTAAAAVILGATLSMAVTRPAQAQASLAEWETAAVGQADDDDAPRTARLFAVDLALPAAGASR